jgi:hypothetical protein
MKNFIFYQFPVGVKFSPSLLIFMITFSFLYNAIQYRQSEEFLDKIAKYRILFSVLHAHSDVQMS